MPKSPPEFGAYHLQNVQIEGVNFAWSEFSCSFNGCVFKNVNLSGSMFDSCRMHKSVFKGCDFSDARLRVVADAALFEECTFRGSQFLSRGASEYGGRRVQFVRCDFTSGVFRNVALRASRFVECLFPGAVFEQCDLRGVKFEGVILSSDQFVGCEVSPGSESD